MPDCTLNELIGAIVGLVGGCILIIGPRFEKASNPLWSIRALSLAGIFAIAYAVTILFKIYLGPDIASRSLYLLKHYRTFFSGTCLGILLTLFISGELNLKKWKRKSE